MRKMFITLAATSALALGACQSPAADKVEDQAEAKADVIDEQADAVEAAGEEKANAMDDSGEIAPSEVAPTTPPADPAKK